MSPRNRLILTIAAVVVVIILLAGLLIYPQLGKLADLDKQIAKTQAEIDQAQSLLEQRQAIKSQAAETDAALLRMSNEFPENPELPSLIIELQDTANEAGIEFRTLTPTVPEQKTGYSAINIKMDCIGEWADAIDFMQRVVKLTRQIRIIGFVATPVTVSVGDGTEETKQKVQLTFDLEAYTLAPVDAAGAATPPAPPAQ